MEKQEIKNRTRLIRNIIVGCFFVAVLCVFFASDITTEVKAGYLKHKIKVDPKDTQSYLDLGEIYWQKDELDNAIEVLEKATRIEPHNRDIWLELGNYYYDSENYQKAEGSYLRAIKEDPDCYDAYVSLGDAYHCLEEYEKSIDPFKKAVDLKQDEGYALLALGLSYYDLGQYEKALEAYKEADKISPGVAGIQILIGKSYEKLDKHREAIVSFELAKSIDPNVADRIFRGAQESFEEGEIEEAIENYEVYMKLKADNPEAYLALGKAYLQIGDIAQEKSAYPEFPISVADLQQTRNLSTPSKRLVGRWRDVDYNSELYFSPIESELRIGTYRLHNQGGIVGPPTRIRILRENVSGTELFYKEFKNLSIKRLELEIGLDLTKSDIRCCVSMDGTTMTLEYTSGDDPDPRFSVYRYIDNEPLGE